MDEPFVMNRRMADLLVMQAIGTLLTVAPWTWNGEIFSDERIVYRKVWDMVKAGEEMNDIVEFVSTYSGLSSEFDYHDYYRFDGKIEYAVEVVKLVRDFASPELLAEYGSVNALVSDYITALDYAELLHD